MGLSFLPLKPGDQSGGAPSPSLIRHTPQFVTPQMSAAVPAELVESLTDTALRSRHQAIKAQFAVPVSIVLLEIGDQIAVTQTVGPIEKVTNLL